MTLVLMLLAVLVVSGAMVATLMVFFRRLRRIEEEFLGPSTQLPWRRRLNDLVFRIRHKIHSS